MVATRTTTLALSSTGRPTVARPSQVGGGVAGLDRVELDLRHGQMLVIYHPDAGTGNADKLALLASASLPPAAPDLREPQPRSGPKARRRP
jgi:hypothetical protein